MRDRKLKRPRSLHWGEAEGMPEERLLETPREGNSVGGPERGKTKAF